MNRHLRLGLLTLALAASDAFAQGVRETVVAPNWNGNILSVYRKNPTIGALEALGAPVAVGQAPRAAPWGMAGTGFEGL